MTILSPLDSPDGRSHSLARVARSQGGSAWVGVLWVLGLPLLLTVFYFLMGSVIADFTALFSAGWVGIAVAVVWLVGFPLYAFLRDDR